MGEEAVLAGGCFGGEDGGVGKYGLFQDFFAGGAVKACPGVAPGVGGVGAVVDGIHWADEKSITCFQMVGVAAALVDAFAVEDHVEEVVRAHGRTEGVVRATVFLTAEVDGKGVLGVGFFFHLTGPPVFLSQKRNILLRRKQFLKKSIQQHRIYKSYKSKSKEKPAAYVKWLQLCIKIGHI